MSAYLLFAAYLPIVIAGTTRYHIPSKPTSGGVLDSGPISISFEFFQYPAYFVNVSNTYPCLDNLKRLTGKWPRIRIGGTSQDYTTYDELYPGYITYPPAPINVAPQNITIGPSYIDLVAKYQGEIVLGLNRGGNNMSNTIQVAKLAEKKIKSLYAIELGNEPVIFPYVGGMSIAPNGTLWTPKIEAESEALWQRSVAPKLNQKMIVQAGNYYREPPEWGAASLIQYEDPASIQYIKTFSHHNYAQGPGAAIPSVPNLMNHTLTYQDVQAYVADVKAARAINRDYVFGETNSVSGGGAVSVSPTFASALWLLDYSLQAATINISRSYFHQGSVDDNSYAWWGTSNVRAAYYGAYAATFALSGGKYISALDQGKTTYSGYIIYSAARKPIRVVLYNSDFFDGIGVRTTEKFLLTGLPGKKSVTRRLTAPNAYSRQDSGQNPTFAGRTFGNTTCIAQGKEKLEVVPIRHSSAWYTVAASEALLIDLSD